MVLSDQAPVVEAGFLRISGQVLRWLGLQELERRAPFMMGRFGMACFLWDTDFLMMEA